MGTISNYIYIDINDAFQHIINTTISSLDSPPTYISALQSYLNSAAFRLADYSTEVTINIPDRIEVYKNSDYQATFN